MAGSHPSPRPEPRDSGRSLGPEAARVWSAVAHVGTLLSAWFAMGFLCPLLIWLLLKDSSDLVRRHAAESLNFQLTLLVYLVGGWLFIRVTLGLGMLVVLPAIVVVGLVALVCIILATVAAADGREFRYPLTIRLVR